MYTSFYFFIYCMLFNNAKKIIFTRSILRTEDRIKRSRHDFRSTGSKSSENHLGCYRTHHRCSIVPIHFKNVYKLFAFVVVDEC